MYISSNIIDLQISYFGAKFPQDKMWQSYNGKMPVLRLTPASFHCLPSYPPRFQG